MRKGSFFRALAEAHSYLPLEKQMKQEELYRKMEQQGLYPAAKAAEDFRYNLRVSRLANGYTLNTHGWQSTFYPDLASLLRTIAVFIGGDNAAELLVQAVSPEEAGLLDEGQEELPLAERVGEGTPHIDGDTYRYEGRDDNGK